MKKTFIIDEVHFLGSDSIVSDRKVDGKPGCARGGFRKVSCTNGRDIGLVCNEEGSNVLTLFRETVIVDVDNVYCGVKPRSTPIGCNIHYRLADNWLSDSI